MTLPTDATDNHGQGGPGSAARTSEVDLTAETYAQCLPNAVWIDGTPWQKDGGVLRPLTMPHRTLTIDRKKLREALRQHRALLALWTSKWDTAPSEWWWTCCDVPQYDLAKIKSQNCRRVVRQGLRACVVRKLAFDVFVPSAYPIYCKAVEGYGESPPSFERFQANAARSAAYTGSDYWGAFIEERMVAYAACRRLDNAVSIGGTKSDADYHAMQPNRALFYELTRQYLDAGVTYVTNGHRTIWHPTTINAFLERMAYRKVYARLNVEVSPVVRAVDRLRVARWGRSLGLARVAPRRWAQLQGLDNLMRIAEAFE